MAKLQVKNALQVKNTRQQAIQGDDPNMSFTFVYDGCRICTLALSGAIPMGVTRDSIYRWTRVIETPRPSAASRAADAVRA
jgi:hypothetical protein